MAENYDTVQAFFANPHLRVGDSIVVATPNVCILGNLPAEGPQLHALAIDDHRRIWKQSCGDQGARLTLVFDPNQGWL